MNEQLYRLTYCSRNRIRGAAEEVEPEIQHILERSRSNNAAAGISGALLYNSGNFAQVLEGPVDAVGATFEKIQRDLRHSEVTVVQNGPAKERQFPDWAMAFAGETSARCSEASTTAAFDAVFANVAGAGEQILAVLQELVVQDEELVLIDMY